MGINIGRTDSVVKRFFFKKPDGTLAGTLSIRRPNNKKSAVKRKKLNYNSREISSQILRTRTSGSAGQVSVRAKGKLAVLQRKLRSGQYDDEEVKKAILHASQMVRVAKKRLRNLQQEERMASAKKEADQAGKAEGVSREASERRAQSLALSRILQKELELLRRKNRIEEEQDIRRADIEYLKSQFAQLEKEKREAGRRGGSSGAGSSQSVSEEGMSGQDATGVSLELGGAEVPVSAVEIPAAVEGGCVDVNL